MMCNFAIHWKMDIIELCDIFNGKAREAAIAKMLASKRNRVIGIDGLAGSASSMLFSRLPKYKCPYLIIANDLDEAGYIYNDLCQINGEDKVLIFPSGYKRDIKYGQIDAPSEILRTEVLNKWYEDKLTLGGHLSRSACRASGV
jgi:transcription-repair coupling factor (superfamily II helicase)